MAKYETMLITSAALDEEATAALVGKFKTKGTHSCGVAAVCGVSVQTAIYYSKSLLFCQALQAKNPHKNLY